MSNFVLPPLRVHRFLPTLPPPPPHPLPPTSYLLLLLLILLRAYLLRNSFMRSAIPIFGTNTCLPGLTSPPPSLVYLEVQPSSHVDGALGVALEGLVCSPHRENMLARG